MRGLLLAVLVAAATCPGAAQELPAFRFHHLHLNDDRPPFLLEFYERLFDPALTSRVVEGESSGLRAGPMLLLFGKGASDASEPTALWHFGWGGVSLGETYLAHARREVAWEPPLPAAQLHLHLRSVTPGAAASWYRDTFGARVELAQPATDFDGRRCHLPNTGCPRRSSGSGTRACSFIAPCRRSFQRAGSGRITSPCRATTSTRRWR